MKRKNIVSLLSRIFLVTALVVVPFVAAYAQAAPTQSSPPAPPTTSKPIVLNAVSFLPRTDPTVRNLLEFVEEIPRRSEGLILANYRGGPEAIPPPQQPKAAQEGVVDIAFTLSGFCETLGIPPLAPLSELKPEVEHQAGGFADQVQEFYGKVGLYYLGRTDAAPEGFFYLATTELVAKPQDLAGLSIESIGTGHVAIVKAFGGAPVTIKEEDLYSALDRGVVRGFWSPLAHIYDRKLWETQLKFVIDHPLLNSTGVVVMNLNKWSQIPKDLQDMVQTVWLERMTAKDRQRSSEDYVRYRKIMEENGMKFIKFSPSDLAMFRNTAYRAEWEKLSQRYPEAVSKYKDLLSGR